MDIVIATLGIFIGGIYGGLVGGSSIVTQIFLQNILNMPIKEAMALDNAACIGGTLGILAVIFWKNTLKWWMIPFIASQIFGAFLGVEILLWIPERLLQIIFIGAIILLVIKNLFFASSKEKKEKGFNDSYINVALLCLAAIAIGTYNAAFVVGDWIIAILILTSVFHFKYQNAIFLLVLSMSISQPFATWGYIENNLVDISFLIPMAISSLVAGVLSGFLLQKIDSKKLETVLKYLSIVLVGYLIFKIL